MRDLLNKLTKLDEASFYKAIEGPNRNDEYRIDFQWSGDDGEEAYGDLYFKVVDGKVDPRSLRGETDEEDPRFGDHKVDSDFATDMVKVGGEDHEDALDIAQQEYDEMNADKDESIEDDSDEQTFEDEIKPGQGALDKFRELYRKGIGSDDAEVVLRELIEVINNDALFADEFPDLKAFTGDEVVKANAIPGNTADEKIESLLKAINDDKWVEDFAEMLMKDFSMDENADLGRIKEFSGLDTNEEDEQTFEGEEFYEYYGYLPWHEDVPVDEAEYRGRKVPLGKPMRGDVKKFKVYVRDPKTKNVKKVNFGDPNMRIKKSNPKRRKSFRARHNCDNPGPRTKARYWSCRKW